MIDDGLHSQAVLVLGFVGGSIFQPSGFSFQ